MMGNIIYLMAANSNKKSEQWAVTMTKTFWAYRVISSWILLITISIFATTDFDGPEIQPYAMRHHQTIETSGIALFLFCWLATPIWQWVGAVAVFDYKNLASLGRDVVQLIHDGKLLDVLELIRFGANDYDPEDALIALCDSKHVNFDDDAHKSLFDALLHLFVNNVTDKKEPIFKLFFRACENNHPRLVSQLLKMGIVDVDATDEYGRSAVFYAAANNHYDVMWELVAINNADCNIKESGGRTVLHFMFDMMDEIESLPDLNIIRLLVEDGQFDVNARAETDEFKGDTVYERAESTEFEDVKNYLFREVRGMDGAFDYFTAKSIDCVSVLSLQEMEEQRKSKEIHKTSWIKDENSDRPILKYTLYYLSCQFMSRDCGV